MLKTENIPWKMKILISLILLLVPKKYLIFRKLNIGKHGNMDDNSYSIRVFQDYFQVFNKYKEISSKKYKFLELGPGDSISTGIISSYNNFERAFLVDKGNYAIKNIKSYKKLIEVLNEKYQIKKYTEINNFKDILNEFNIRYFTKGLKSLMRIPTGSVDLICSKAVLEHLSRDEFITFQKELFRILKKGGICYHVVDYRDHLTGKLNHMRLSWSFWESKIWKKVGIYTNRITFIEMKNLFLKIGYLTQYQKIRKWNKLNTPKSKLIKYFRTKSDEELSIFGGVFILKK